MSQTPDNNSLTHSRGSPISPTHRAALQSLVEALGEHEGTRWLGPGRKAGSEDGERNDSVNRVAGHVLRHRVDPVVPLNLVLGEMLRGTSRHEQAEVTAAVNTFASRDSCVPSKHVRNEELACP